jgi:proline iminopeptidase
MRSRLLLLVLIASACVTCSAQSSDPNLFPIQDGFVDSHGALIYCMSVGRGAPLMIVHGGPGASHDYFLPYLLPLMRTNRLVFIDERGSGKSSKLDDPKQYTIANMVEDIEAVRHALDLGKISLLGHSFGGALVQAYAFKYQKNLSHLILGSTFSSTVELNQALAKMKAEMSPKDRDRVMHWKLLGCSAREKSGSMAAIPRSTPNLPGARATSLMSIRTAPIPITTR